MQMRNIKPAIGFLAIGALIVAAAINAPERTTATATAAAPAPAPAVEIEFKVGDVVEIDPADGADFREKIARLGLVCWVRDYGETVVTAYQHDPQQWTTRDCDPLEAKHPYRIWKVEVGTFVLVAGRPDVKYTYCINTASLTENDCIWAVLPVGHTNLKGNVR